MRVIFDANIYVSFILTGGKTIASLFSAWNDQKFSVLVSDEILQEIEEVIGRFQKKNQITEETAQETLQKIYNDAQLITVTSQTTQSPDEKDNRYLACAKDGEADYLITGDVKHLLPLKTFGKTRIIPPAEFIVLLQEKPI